MNRPGKDATEQPRRAKPHGSTWTTEELEAEYDPRLADVWISVFEMWPGGPVPEQLAWFLRMAYTVGYGDALTEEAGGLFKNLGLIPHTALQGHSGRQIRTQNRRVE